MKKFLPPLALVCIALIAVWMVRTASREAEPPKKAANAGPAQTMEGVKLEGGGPGGAKWTLSAESAASDAAGELGALTGVTVTYEGKSGLVTGRAGKAEKGAGGAFLFSGGVEIAWRDLTARTQKAVYDPAKGLITTGDPVEITLDRGKISGTGLVADLERSSAKIIANSRATLKGAGR